MFCLHVRQIRSGDGKKSTPHADQMSLGFRTHSLPAALLGCLRQPVVDPAWRPLRSDPAAAVVVVVVVLTHP